MFWCRCTSEGGEGRAAKDGWQRPCSSVTAEHFNTSISLAALAFRGTNAIARESTLTYYAGDVYRDRVFRNGNKHAGGMKREMRLLGTAITLLQLLALCTQLATGQGEELQMKGVSAVTKETSAVAML